MFYGEAKYWSTAFYFSEQHVGKQAQVENVKQYKEMIEQ